MENLAGDYNAAYTDNQQRWFDRVDATITEELTKAKICVIPQERSSAEVRSAVRGQLGKFSFERAGYYWVVKGPVPLPVADEMYADPIGKVDVRVAGHYGCSPPEEGATLLNLDGKELVPLSEKRRLLQIFLTEERIQELFDDHNLVWSNDLEAEGNLFVTLYRIDSLVGLRLFTDTLRRHNLVEEDDHLEAKTD
jgi:hypothetical protein